MARAGMPRSPRFCGASLIAVLAAWPTLAQVAQPAVVDGAIPAPLTDVPGDPVRGAALVRDMTRASCLICHAMPIADEPDQGNIGPDLAGVASRLSAGELRLRLVDARAVNPATVMPPYHATEGLTRVRADLAGQPIYTAQEVEDVLAYLLTLEAG